MKYLLFNLVVVLILSILGNNPFWRFHLITDVNTYQTKVGYYLEHHNFGGMVLNEYLPGAMLFFVFISYFSKLFPVGDSFVLSLWIVNFLLILGLSFLYQKINSKGSVIFPLILLAMGPIVLYRFDLYVMFWVILALFFWQRSKYEITFILLGFATLIKIFPIIFIPLLLIILYKEKGLKRTYQNPLYYFLGLLIPLLLYMVFFKVGISDLIGLNYFHAMRPVSVESIWGSALTIISKVQVGVYAKGLGDWGTFGIAPSYLIGPLTFYSNFWVVPLSFLYLWFLKSKDKEKYLFQRCLILVLTFLIFYKSITPQYFLWFALLLPLVEKNIFSQLSWRITSILTLIISIFYQYIYPLNYFSLIEFYNNGNHPELFWLNTFRNCLLLILLVNIISSLKNER